MADAQDIIDLFNAEDSRARPFLGLYQDTAEYVFPLESSITTRGVDGQSPALDIVDTTAIFDAQDMASGLSSTMIPPGQPFFSLGTTDHELNERDDNKRWLAGATEIAHDAIWNSNFLMQFDEFLKSWGVFGEAGIFSERGRGANLNFREYPAGSFHYLENYQRLPDTFMEKFEFTARQAIQAFGRDAVGMDVRAAADDPKRVGDLFEYIHVCQPRITRDVFAIDTANMPYEDVYVDVKTKMIVKEGGFEEFAYHIGRWAKSAKETRGRGIGVYALPQIRSINSMKRDLVECANRHNNPALEILPGVEGKVDISPRGLNYVTQANSIRAITGTAGNFPITEQLLANERMEIHRAFMVDVFNQLMNLQGDRRTTTEINERLREGLRRLAQPVGRLIAEVMDGLITRSVLILIRNGVIPPPPPSLSRRQMKVQYISFLVLMLKQYQSQAFARWVTLVANLEAIFPGVKDNVDADRAVRDSGMAYGVSSLHIRSIVERDKIRAQRAQDLAAQQALAVQQQMAESYKQATRAPESGSLAEKALNGG